MAQIAIIVYPGFTALDLIGPYEVLQRVPDAEIRFVWHESGPVASDSGNVVLGATHTFAETPSPDVVVVPGGSASVMVHARDDELLNWLRRVDSTTTFTASVCSGSVILGAAGLLEGRRATSHWQCVPLLKTFGVQPVNDQRIVIDDRVVTSAGVSAGIDMALWMARELSSERRAQAIQLAIEYDPQPPFDSGSLHKASRDVVASANALLVRESASPAHIGATAGLLWDHAIGKARNPRRRWRRRTGPVGSDPKSV